MLNPISPKLEKHRRIHPTLGTSPVGSDYGYFELDSPDGILRVISSGTGEDWEHVSVSHPNRCPTWYEMCRVKDLFWGPNEVVVQLHVPPSKHINISETCLHLWKQTGVNHPLPPREFV